MQKVSQSWCLISKNNSSLLSTSIGTVLVQDSIISYLFYWMAPRSFLLLLLSPGHPFYTLQPEWTFKSINHIMSPSTYILQDFLSLEDNSREDLYSSRPIRPAWAGSFLCVWARHPPLFTSFMPSSHPGLAFPQTHLKTFGFVLPFA